MKHYQILNWGMVMVSFIFTLILFMHAPSRIVMHFNGVGRADSWASPVGLYLEPIFLSLRGFVSAFRSGNVGVMS